MKVTLLSKTESRIKLLIEDVDVGFVNALRRVLVSEIPVYAVDHIIVYENTSQLYDEILAHRLGLVPLSTPANVDKEVTLSIEKEGPGVVYTKDMISDDDSIKPIIPDIPITKLGNDQKIKINCIAKVGIAKDHAKYQCCLAFYKYFPVINIDKKCDLCGVCVEVCPKSILKIEKDSLKITDIKECTLCRTCEEQCDLQAISVSYDNRKFIFTVENYGNMSVRDLIEISTGIIEGKCDEFIDKIAGVAEPGQRR